MGPTLKLQEEKYLNLIPGSAIPRLRSLGKSWLQLLSASILPCVVGMLKGKPLGHHHQGLRVQGDEGLSPRAVAVAEVSASGSATEWLSPSEVVVWRRFHEVVLYV